VSEDKKNLKQLRRTSKRIRDLTNPFLFKEMKFSMPHLRAIVRERMNAVLRDGQTSFLQSVRKLTVITQPTGGNVYVKSAKFDLLNSLITKMHLVHAIE